MTTDLGILQQRQIEAAVIKPIYEEMAAAFGEKAARDVLDNAIRKAAIAHGQKMAETAEGKTSLANFADNMEPWTRGGALEIEILEKSDTAFNFNVTRCKYSEMYKDMGVGDIGHLLSCNRDGTFCTGYDPKLKLSRTQTIMGGASHCNFRYSYEDGNID